MNISILSVFPELFFPFLNTSLVQRCQQTGQFTISTPSYFSYVTPKERIDAPTSGPGPGMLIKPEVVQKAVEDQEQRHGTAFKIFFSPQGKKLTQKKLAELYHKISSYPHLMLITARYEGMDARVEEIYADEIISVGDFVVMGGEIPAMLLLEGLLRLFPGVIGKQLSQENDSFVGAFVDFPEYTLPVEWQGLSIPEVVRSGNHARIEEWRWDQAAQKSVYHHFEWVRSHRLTDRDVALIRKNIPPHYVVLMHTDVLVGPERIPGTTSVTSIDIHDIARSARTYGVKNFFVVTPLKDQQHIVSTLLSFWQEGTGITYNPSRHDAVNRVSLLSTFQEVIDTIEQQEGVRPLAIATSAQADAAVPVITYADQELLWGHHKPILIILGTGQGLAPQLIAQTDYLFIPVRGFETFNHLSVRSAAAIILDRWLGRQEKN